jgi:hypothetical protein
MKPLAFTSGPAAPALTLVGLREVLQGMRADLGAQRCRLEWVRGGAALPAPHCVKEVAVRRFAKQHGLGVLIETGTYLGQMVAAVARHFEQVISIELSHELAEAARLRFAGETHITILEGDSEDVLHHVLRRLERPALFWLDAHYSEGKTARSRQDTPITFEIASIMSHAIGSHVVLIDDARLFDGTNSYPTVEWVAKAVASRYQLHVEDDIICLQPR